MKKNELEKLAYNSINDENADKRIYFKFYYLNIIYLSLYIILLIISIIFNNRMYLLSKLILDYNLFIIIIYYIALAFKIAYHLVMAVYSYNLKKRQFDWATYAYKWYKRLDLSTFIAGCLAVLLFVIAYIFTPCNVYGSSMENTYNDGDKIICSDLFYKPKKNDVIVFDSSSYTDESELYIKRITAVEDDRLIFDKDNNILYVNENIASNDFRLEQYLNILESMDVFEYSNEVIIPKDKILVLGDNRRVSYDSRYFGLINEKDILGRVLFRLYPFGTPEANIIE